MAAIAVAALIAAAAQSATGLGFALLLGPALVALREPTTAIVTLTALGLLLNVLVLGAERRRPDVAWAELRLVLAASVPGAVCGVLVLNAVPKAALQAAVGVAVLAAVAVRLRVVVAGTGETREHVGTGARVALGVGTGALSTSVGVNGPPLALYLGDRGLGPRAVRDSLAAAFTVQSLISAAALAPTIPGAVDARVLAASAPAVVVGHALGRRVFAGLHPDRQAAALLVVVAAAGLASLVAGLAAL